ncbi:metallophosphoesterase family protein [Rhizobium sp. 18055]|jgi:serine/threonine protein phosphatase 1|uniref:metallophosphoesterase family protein n=1 Tax=Rhizobium sp. 18055 TaxID=2681403 RepID=UPI00135BAAD0|nr:metallophosphoesterase family protein [Rhizobium sp. 18055]
MLKAARRFLSRMSVGKQQPGHRRQHLDIAGQDYVAIYAIGDVHGCHDKLVLACNAISADASAQKGRTLAIFLGDYVDRGMQSKSVLNYITNSGSFDFGCLFLCGNHDEAFLNFCRDPGRSLSWLDLGGRETLMSYGIDADHMLNSAGGIASLSEAVAQVVPARHLEFIENLPVLAKIGQNVFVHAGIRPGVPLAQQSDRDLMWIREPFLSRGPELDLTVVHGHTVSEEPAFGRNRIGIDTGAYESGRLTVMRMTGSEISFLAPTSARDPSPPIFQSVASLRLNGQ